MLLDNLKAGGQIIDFDEFRSYAVHQPQVARVTADKMTRDAQVLAKLSGQFNAQSAKLLQEQIGADRQVA